MNKDMSEALVPCGVIGRRIGSTFWQGIFGLRGFCEGKICWTVSNVFESDLYSQPSRPGTQPAEMSYKVMRAAKSTQVANVGKAKVSRKLCFVLVTHQKRLGVIIASGLFQLRCVGCGSDLDLYESKIVELV